MASFVIVVDTQRDFISANGALAITGAEALVPGMQLWLEGLNTIETAGVLFTFDTHVPEIYAGSPEAEAFPIHCVRGSAGWANLLDVASVDQALPVWRLEKGVFDMWAEPGLAIEDARGAGRPAIDRDLFFEGLKARGIDEIIVIGVAADYCVRWAIDGLIARGFRVTVPAGMTLGIERQIDRVAAEDFAGAALTIA